MKRFFCILASVLLLSVVCRAQLRVLSNGSLKLGSINGSMNFSFIESNDMEGYTRYGWNSMTVSNGADAVGCYNNTMSFGTWKSSIASANLAHSDNGIYHIGVMGMVPQTMYGTLPGNLNGFNAAVYGISSDSIGGVNCPVPLGQGSYAGYFVGDTYVNGMLTATSIYTPSDMQLKENVEPLNVTERGNSILENVMGMNVIQYNYKDRDYEMMDVNAGLSEEMKKVLEEYEEKYEGNNNTKTDRQKDLHFGLSAQELQEVFPNLVKEGQDGYLGVNYTELVPVLIKCIQEMQQEIDELKGASAEAKAKANILTEGKTGLTAMAADGNKLFQNRPNPFKEQTEIGFSLAEGVKDAAICIFDMQGKMLKSHPVQQGMSSVIVNGYELGAGMFLYSLVVDGQEVDTKKMILSK